MSENATKTRRPTTTNPIPATPTAGRVVEPKPLPPIADSKLMRRPRISARRASAVIPAARLLRLQEHEQEVVRRCWSAMADLDPAHDREDIAYLESLIQSVARRQRASGARAAKSPSR
jgi:hypothetical protein